MISKKKLLADDKFKIGFEFEFVACNLDSILDNQFRKLRIPEILLHELDTCFHISKQDKKNAENILSYAGYNMRKYDYYSSLEDFIEYGPDRMIALLGLMPSKMVYRKVGDAYKDVTDEIKNKISTTDRTDPKDLSRLIRSLRKCYVDAPVLGNYTTLTPDGEKQAYKAIILEFKRHSGITMRRIKSYDAVTKKKPGWYLTEEYVDDIKEDAIEFGFEIVTPALHPLEALDALDKVLSFLRSDAMPFNIRTGMDCGVHINISHEDKTSAEVNQVFYGLMFDDAPVIKLFGRSKQNMCSPTRPMIIREIKRLTREKAINIDTLDDPKTAQRVLDIIEASSDGAGLNSARFSSMDKWNYVEYRMAGGKGYQNKYNELEAVTIDLLRLTMSYTKDNTRNKVFMATVRDIMVSAGARTGTGPSVIESMSEFLTKHPKTKRGKRLDAEELLKIRDV